MLAKTAEKSGRPLRGEPGWRALGERARGDHRRLGARVGAELAEQALDVRAHRLRGQPELAHVPGAAVHQPWTAPGGFDHGYPERIGDHAAERAEALRRYSDARGDTPH